MAHITLNLPLDSNRQQQYAQKKEVCHRGKYVNDRKNSTGILAQG